MKKNRIKIFVNFMAMSVCLTTTVFAQEITQEHLMSHIGKYPNYPIINAGAGPQAELIKRGEYLAKAGDCIACHTKTGGIPFSGGLPIVTPFGIIYSPNI